VNCLRDGTVRETSGRSAVMATRRARRRDYKRLLCRGLGVLAVGAGSLAAVACAGFGGEARTGATRNRLVASHEEVVLLPSTGAGEGGWCMTTNAGGGCPTFHLPVFQGPIVVESWSGREIYIMHDKAPLSEAVREATLLTTSEVVAVSLEGGAPIATQAESALPGNLRGVVVERRGESNGRVRGLFGTRMPAPLPFPRSRFIALNAKGEPIPQTRAPGPPLEFHVARQSWGPSRRAPRGVCGLVVRSLAGLVFKGGAVMTAVRPHLDVRGREFVDCVSASYLLNNWPLTADVLLDAAHPGVTPAPLPDMRPLAGHPMIFQAPGVEGETVARRLPGAWLVVAKGKGLPQRLTLLEHLRAMIHIVPGR
jgi:hypothetical protein